MTSFANMRGSVIVSVSAHVLLILFAQFGLPNLFTPREVSVTVIPVELVTLDTIDTPPPAAPEPEPEPEAAAPPPPPPPPEPEPEPEPEVVEAPPPPEPEPEPEPEVVEAPPPPAEKPKPPEKAEPPKPNTEPAQLAQARPQSKPEPPKPAKPEKDFNSVLKNLRELETTPTPAPKSREPSPPKDQGDRAPEQQVAERPPSISELERLRQLIRQQIEPCWSPPIGAESAEDLAVTILIRVDRGGTVIEASVVDGGIGGRNSFARAAAEAARRAVLNPACQPFQLPQNRYDLWKEIRFNFDPREALG